MADDFERLFMGGADAVHSEKVKLKTLAGVMLGLAGFMAVLTVILAYVGATGAPAAFAGAGASALVALVAPLFGLAFSVVRTVVTHQELRVATGTKEAAIPLASITSAEAVVFDSEERRRFRKARARDFGARAKNGRVARVDWEDEDGTAHAAYIASEDADDLVRVIARTRGGVAKPKRKVRVEAAAEEEAEEVEAKTRTRRKAKK